LGARVLGGVVARPDGLKKFQIRNSACALPSAGEAAPGCAESALVLPAKSQSGFIEEIDQLTVEIHQVTIIFHNK
jgi:hypothetical protein